MPTAPKVVFEPYTPPEYCKAKQSVVCYLPPGHEEPHAWEGDVLLCKRCDCWSNHPWFWRVVWHPIFVGKQRLASTRLFNWLYWKAGRRPVNRKWWIRWLDVGYAPCEQCGLDWDWGYPPWFSCTAAGNYSDMNVGRVYWFEGIQTCPRCLHEWEYGGSS